MVTTLMAVVAMVRWLKKLLELEVCQIGEDPVLDVAAEEALFREGDGVLVRVHSPPEHPAEKEGAVRFTRHVLVQVVLEEFLWLAGLLHILCYRKMLL